MTEVERQSEPPVFETEDDAFEQRLLDLGAESRTAHTTKRVVPWIISLAFHLGVVLLGFLATWTVVLLRGEEEPVEVIADFNALAYDPVQRLDFEQADVTVPETQDRVETFEQIVEDRLDESQRDPITQISNATSSDPLAQFAPEPVEGKAEFVGLSSSNVRKICYVIDASGSMIPTLPIVLQELQRSLEQLAPPQEFGIFFFQGNESLAVPPGDRLISATHDQKVRALEWVNEQVIPRGRSNPLNAIEQALRLDPDVIFLLSNNITGSGEFEIDQRDLLELLDRLNPADGPGNTRRTAINCIQFLDPDPLDTLRKIAEIHGGVNGYKFLDRRELGIAPR